MPYQITFRATTDYREDPERPGVKSIRRACDDKPLRVGDAYFPHPSILTVREDGVLCAAGHETTKFYDQHWRDKRQPIALVLPDRYHLVIDSAYWSGSRDNPNRDGWGVLIEGEIADGQPLVLTMNPSVNIVGSYHGWVGYAGVRPGWIGDDLEGRAAKHAEYWGGR